MPRVTCGRCSRELDYSGEDRPQFCAFCGQSLATPPPEATLDGRTGSATVFEPVGTGERGDATIDYVPKVRSAVRAAVPERVKGYRLLRQLGRGGMGTVYEAEDSRHGRKVALKIIAPGYVDSAGAVERFRQEGRLASGLSHPRCVFVLEADEDDDGRPFIAMELMTGDTLQDLVEKGGPLAVGDAVAKILDVVEGLREAHRLGLIHRDVKPSNCFLDAEGRVKVGDFGLSKSQAGESHLTRTGSFLGTPLYASPEQIKVEPLDARTDVYSTAATLYYLLVGRAPFDKGDASATMARIVTEPAPSAREQRPEVPVGLDRAVRKGLERDRDRRFRDLGEFQEALRPFAPGRAASARFSLRVGAYLFDGLFVAALATIGVSLNVPPLVHYAVKLPLMLAYFAVGDGVWGGSPGKRLLRLRVAEAGGRDLAGPGRAAARAVVFLTLGFLPVDLFFFAVLEGSNHAWLAGYAALCGSVEVVGLLALAWPMRRGDPGRGLHDLVAGTRVVGLARPERRREAGLRRAIGRDRGSGSRPVGVMQSVGPYKVRGAVRWEPGRKVVAGEDPALGREAWIVIRPKGSAAPEPARRELARPTRPRWLAGGEQNEGRWDAYIAPAGCPLADLAGPEGLPWRDARPILEDLADELSAAVAEGSLPPGLTVDQVWVQPDGRALLVDPLALAPEGESIPNPGDDGRALALLREAAALALEGGRHRPRSPTWAIRAAVPIHASAWLAGLLGGPGAHPDLATSRLDLARSRELPAEVGLAQRATSLGVLTLFVAVGLAFGYGMTYASLVGAIDKLMRARLDGTGTSLEVARFRGSILLASAFPLAWVVWDFATAGGFASRLAGLELVRLDGRKPPRWRCAWRSLLVWTPPTALLILAAWARSGRAAPDWSSWLPFGLAVALLPAYFAAACLPDAPVKGGPHDRLSGLRVVPR